MGECIGLDFGTTYTIMSRKNPVTGVMEEIDCGDIQGEGNTPTVDKYVPSIVSIDMEDRTVRVGRSAVDSLDYSECRSFRGFKMLLEESNEQLIKAKGYDYTAGSDYSPKGISRAFLKELFDKAKRKNSISEIDRVIVGVPYIWTSQSTDGETAKKNDKKKQLIAEIVQEASGAKDVDFQEEPRLACGFFVDKITKNTGKIFDGNIIVIDYGGGTLDITLCRAIEKDNKPYVYGIKSFGKGENTDGKVGQAGLRFMERVADLTLKDNGISEDEINKNHMDDSQLDANSLEAKRKYSAFVLEIENNIIKRRDKITRNMRDHDYTSPRSPGYRSEISGVKGSYGRDVFVVKHCTLIEAYKEIEKTLNAELAAVKAWIDGYNAECDKNGNTNDRIDYADSTTGRFKIATIGGFCNFVLTHNQITEEIVWLKKVDPTGDKRYEYMEDQDRAVAVSYGAALLANDIIQVPKQYPYTLKAYGAIISEENVDSKGNVINYGFNADVAFEIFTEGDRYTPGELAFLKLVGNSEKYSPTGLFIPWLRRELDGKPQKEFKPQLKMDLPGGGKKEIYIAIAMEKQEKLTLYVYDKKLYDDLSAEEQEKKDNKALIGSPKTYPAIEYLSGILS